MGRVTDKDKICTRCDSKLSYIYAIYKLSFYCISCYQEEVNQRRVLIDNLPEVEAKEPPLGWLHKFEEEDVDMIYSNMGILSLWES